MKNMVQLANVQVVQPVLRHNVASTGLHRDVRLAAMKSAPVIVERNIRSVTGCRHGCIILSFYAGYCN